MKFVKMETVEQFESLKKGDVIIVKWDKYTQRHSDKKEIELYKIYQNKYLHNEIICRKKGNHFFNYMMYLGYEPNNPSNALEVWRVKP